MAHCEYKPKGEESPTGAWLLPEVRWMDDDGGTVVVRASRPCGAETRRTVGAGVTPAKDDRHSQMASSGKSGHTAKGASTTGLGWASVLFSTKGG